MVGHIRDDLLYIIPLEAEQLQFPNARFTMNLFVTDVQYTGYLWKKQNKNSFIFDMKGLLSYLFAPVEL